MRKTNGAGCSNDFECYTNIGLTCQSGTCQCDSVHFWNYTYVLGGGLPNGRCQNQKSHGMWGSGYTNEWGSGATYGAVWNSQINRVYCNINSGWYLNFQYGTCIYMGDIDYPCLDTQECRVGYTLCMSPNNDGNKRCVPIPTKFIWTSWTYGEPLFQIN